MVIVRALGLATGCVLLSALASPMPAAAAPAQELSLAEFNGAKAALSAARRGDWERAQSMAERVGHPLVDRIVVWLSLTRRPDPRFEDLVAFAKESTDWPAAATLRLRAEESLPLALAPQSVINWFDANPPRTESGRLRLAEALLAVGRETEGMAALREVWVNADFSTRFENDFLSRHGERMDEADHIARLDRLLWDGQFEAAERMLARVPEGYRFLAMARARLLADEPGVDSAIARVPEALRADPGLTYARLLWRDRRDRYESSMEILVEPPEKLIRPEAWWRLRNDLMRTAFDNGFIADAYRLASRHAQTDGIGFAEAEWMAGWIALRFLGEPAVAFEHFVAMASQVSYPISIGRAAYWAGRAAEAMEDMTAAHAWYKAAAAQATTFYGQLAAERLGRDHLTLPAEPVFSGTERRAFEGREVVQAARLLGRLGEQALARRFFVHLALEATSAAEYAAVSAMAAEYGQPRTAVRAAKIAARIGLSLVENGYPVVAVSELAAIEQGSSTIEAATVLALARQESEFDPRAVSPAGALGLMQLMPATARQVAESIDLPFSEGRLTADAGYNIQLGSTYFASLLEDFGGAHVLALAAYNAGPSRVRRWLRELGDPRTGEVDVIDWIEMIPFAETRNYVQRVLEGMQVYRHLLAGDQKPELRLTEDMLGRPMRFAEG